MSFQPEQIAIASDTFTGIKVYAEQDPDLSQPHEDDESVIIVVLTRNQTNPGEHAGLRTVEDVEAFEEANQGEDSEWAIFPLFMYSHGLNVYQVSKGGNPFSDPWDSGRVGILALKRADFGEGVDFYTTAQGSAQAYTDWANGNGWGYVVENAEGETLDSCWGFVGDHDETYFVGEAMEAYNQHVKTETERLKNDTAARIERQGKLAAKLAEIGFDAEDVGPETLMRLAKGDGSLEDFLTVAEYLADYSGDD